MRWRVLIGAALALPGGLIVLLGLALAAPGVLLCWAGLERLLQFYRLEIHKGIRPIGRTVSWPAQGGHA
jgi:hypothetical protein